jgi:hypothetical protein
MEELRDVPQCIESVVMLNLFSYSTDNHVGRATAKGLKSVDAS